MTHQMTQARLITGAIFLLVLLATAMGRPQHFGENSQINGEQDQQVLNVGGNSVPSELQLEWLAQRLADYNGQYGGSNGWMERVARTPEIKRKNQFRLCYFNPVSCFKK